MERRFTSIICFSLLTNYSNYIAFDEALVLMDQPKKAIAKIRKSTTFQVQPLDNKLRRYTCKSIFIVNNTCSYKFMLFICFLCCP